MCSEAPFGTKYCSSSFAVSRWFQIEELLLATVALAGAAIAVEASDVALFSNDLRCLAPVISLGRLSRRKIIENISLSVATKVCACDCL